MRFQLFCHSFHLTHSPPQPLNIQINYSTFRVYNYIFLFSFICLVFGVQYMLLIQPQNLYQFSTSIISPIRYSINCISLKSFLVPSDLLSSRLVDLQAWFTVSLQEFPSPFSCFLYITFSSFLVYFLVWCNTSFSSFLKATFLDLGSLKIPFIYSQCSWYLQNYRLVVLFLQNFKGTDPLSSIYPLLLRSLKPLIL